MKNYTQGKKKRGRNAADSDSLGMKFGITSPRTEPQLAKILPEGKGNIKWIVKRNNYVLMANDWNEGFKL